MSLFGVKVVQAEAMGRGEVVMMFDGKVVWFGKIAEMRGKAPYRFDTIHMNPADVLALRDAVPRIPAQSGGSR